MRYRAEREFYQKYKKALKIENEINSGNLKRSKEWRYLIQAFKYVNNGRIKKDIFYNFKKSKKSDLEKEMEKILKDVIYSNLV